MGFGKLFKLSRPAGLSAQPQSANASAFVSAPFGRDITPSMKITNTLSELRIRRTATTTVANVAFIHRRSLALDIKVNNPLLRAVVTAHPPAD
jgi:hypothetical protein